MLASLPLYCRRSYGAARVEQQGFPAFLPRIAFPAILRGYQRQKPSVVTRLGGLTNPEMASAAILDYHSNKAVGTLLGCMSGDVLGAAVEGWPAERIASMYPSGLTTFARTNRGFGCYTDDTQMTIALATSLVKLGRCDARDCAFHYAELFDIYRGYGGFAKSILSSLKNGTADYATSGRSFREEGSYANGGAMRISPIGLAYRHALPPLLKQAVESALLCTHVHPIAIDGALIQAAAVGWLSKRDVSDARCTPAALLEQLLELPNTEAMRGKLKRLQDELPNLTALGNSPVPIQSWAVHLRSESWAWELGMSQAVGSPFQLEASEAVASALLALLAHWRCPMDAVVAAVHYGGDTDTIAAMAGALAGALHGRSWLPEQWLSSLENGEHGRDEVIALAMQLAKLDCREHDHGQEGAAAPKPADMAVTPMTHAASPTTAPTAPSIEPMIE